MNTQDMQQSLEQQFCLAVERVDEMKRFYNPGQQAALYLYARYRQARDGDVLSERPSGFLHPIRRQKWDAWNTVRGMPSEQAMREYIDYVKKL